MAGKLTPAQRRRQRAAKAFWKVANPPVRFAAGRVPFWVLLETTGRKSGVPRQIPLAHGAEFDGATWFIASHGRHAAFVRNIESHPRVRLRTGGRWRTGVATVEPLTEERAARFSRYARGGITAGIDPCLVRIELDP